MLTWLLRTALCCTCVLESLPCEPLVAQDSSAELHFVRRIGPLLQSKCLACHGDSAKIEGGLDLRTSESALRGGDSEVAVVVKGEPDKSPLYLAATRTHAQWSAMPPKDAEGLDQVQLMWLRDWIGFGAVWPSTERFAEITNAFADVWSAEDGVSVATSGGLSSAASASDGLVRCSLDSKSKTRAAASSIAVFTKVAGIARSDVRGVQYPDS